MNPLNLSPLPSMRVPENHHPSDPSRYLPGFVDDSVVMALLKNTGVSSAIQHEDVLAFSSDELDFAGWNAAAAMAS